MQPALFGIPSYGLFFALGFTCGVGWVAHTAPRHAVEPGRARSLCFWIALASLLGARLCYVLIHHEIGRLLVFWHGGLVFYGGLAGGLIALAGFGRFYQLPLALLGDLIAPALALGHSIGRVGCWLAGCCFGRPCKLPWGSHFPPSSIAFQVLVAEGRLSLAAGSTPALHPTQLYEAIGELTLFALLTRLQPKRPGASILLYLGGYALLRAMVELFRGDAARKFMGAGLSTSQLGSLVVALVLLVAWCRNFGAVSLRSRPKILPRDG